MGAITDPEQHAQDVLELKTVGLVCPAFKRHLSHHLRNSLSSILASTEMAQHNLDAGRPEALRNDLARILKAAEHILSDLNEVNL